MLTLGKNEPDVIALHERLCGLGLSTSAPAVLVHGLEPPVFEARAGELDCHPAMLRL